MDAIQRQLRIGWSQGSWFIEGDGAGTISSDNGFLMGVQAWRIAAVKTSDPWLQTDDDPEVALWNRHGRRKPIFPPVPCTLITSGYAVEPYPGVGMVAVDSFHKALAL